MTKENKYKKKKTKLRVILRTQSPQPHETKARTNFLSRKPKPKLTESGVPVMMMMMMKINIHSAISASTDWNCSLIRPHRNNTLRPFNFAPSSSLSMNTISSNRITCSSNSHSIKTYRLSQLTNDEVLGLKTRPRIDFSSIFSVVNPIVHDVQRRGDAAVKEYTSRFDKVELDKLVEIVPELPDPVLDPHIKEAFDVAYGNIYAFHAAQKSPERSVENMKGVQCKRVARSINSVGLYVPGGTAVLPSTALMLAVPAQIAGCKTIVLATPPTQDGNICKEVLYCAKKAGVTHILKAGGAQAISAMAWGTETCPKVEKIFGPGNQYVTAAKMILQNSEAMVSIDMPAGPSEVLVIADKHAIPSHVAADLLSQAEHGPDSQVVLVTAGDGVDLNSIQEELSKQCNSLPRGEFASKALGHSFIVHARDMLEAITFSNLYAPEHLIINVKDADKWESFIENAGSVFLGPWTPESVGDYASGTNHVLPTYGYARMYGGVSLDSFLKYITVQSLTEEGLRRLGPYVATMAEVEGLEAHKRAVTLRLQDIEARNVSR
ncbi:histidinol dehydrogenase, chloroplastic [Arachis hypogaea]